MPNVVRVSRRLAAPPERVLDAWLDPATASRFLFATPTGRMVRAEIEPRVGGAFVLVDRRDGEDVAHQGEFVELVRPSTAPGGHGRLAFRFSVPRYSAEVTRVTVDVAPDGAGTALTLSHEPVPPEWAARTEEGWRSILDALAGIVEE